MCEEVAGSCYNDRLRRPSGRDRIEPAQESPAVSPFPLLRKPAWEDRDASRRATAVATLAHPDLLSKLPELARKDPDAGVRYAAVRRLDELAVLGDRLRNDADAGVRGAARQRFLQCLLDPAVAQAERERIIAVEDDIEILVTLAEQAPEPDLRRLALERVARPGLEVERCIKDPDPQLRLWLLDRIDDVATLERIAERVRKTDKLITRRARERAQALQLAAGDPVATQQRALAICEELDNLRRSVAPDAASQRELLAQEWQSLAVHLDEAMERRVQGYFEALDTALAVPLEPDPELTLPEPEPESTPVAVPAREPDAALAALLAELEARSGRLDVRALEDMERRWLARVRQIEPLLPEELEQEQRFREKAGALQRRFEQRARQRQETLDALPGRIEALGLAVEAGQVTQARELQGLLDADRQVLGEQFPRALARRFAGAVHELDRLGEWQRWSTNKARLRLVGAVDDLAGSGLHPDAIATRLKELQAQWRQLDVAEARPADAPEHPLTGRFHASGRRVLAPARPYFEKRSELRDARREEVETFLDEAEARVREALPLPELVALRRKVIDRLRPDDGLEGGVRREFGRRLRAVLNHIKIAVGESEAEGEAAKRKLLANLRRDLMHAELDAALPIARQAQTAWKALPRASRKAEDALWAELRELVDPWFEQANAKQRERHAAQTANQDEARAILEQLEQLAEADAATLAQAESRLANLRSRWLALAASLSQSEDVESAPRGRRSAHPPRKPAREGLDERAYDRAVARVQAARERQAQLARRAELERLAGAGELCNRLEALPPDAAEDARSELLAQLEDLDLPGDARSAIEARIRVALDPAPMLPLDASLPPAAERAQQLVVLAELGAGVDSPEAVRDLRRRLQIERLSARLSGSDTGDDDLRVLLLESIALPDVPASLRTALAPRWRALLDTARS